MDMRRLMEQAQQMQRKLKKVEEELDTTEYEGMTPDEAIRRAEYFQKLDGTVWILLDACLREFENLFMKVY